MKSKTAHLYEKYYTNKAGWENGTLAYHRLLDSHLNNPEFRALEIGSGPTNVSSTMVAKRVAHLDGLDIDPRALKNAALTKAYIYDGREFPMEDDLYDVIVADYVMEHVEFPELMFTEINRVLKEGGHFIFRTPNIAHYVSLISRFTPQSFHLAVANKSRELGETQVDPYPTFYRCNSSTKVKRLAKAAGLEVSTLDLIEKQPAYLQFNALAYMLGVGYERVVNATPLLKGLRSNVFCALQKPAR